MSIEDEALDVGICGESVGTGPCGGEVFGQILARMSGMLDLSSEVPLPEAFAVGIAGRITGDKT